MDPKRWSEEEFGEVDLHDARLDRRLLLIAQRVAESSGGTVASVFRDAAERQGAYDFLANDRVAWASIASASYAATVARCAGEEFVFVPEDGSSLSITDGARAKGTGPVGARKLGARGFQVMNSIAVSAAGVPLGVVGQAWWTRAETPAVKSAKARTTDEKETRYWGSEMSAVRERFRDHGGGTIPWFQLDRGGDAWPVLLEAAKEGQWVTIRSAYDRRVVEGPGGGRTYLHKTMEAAPILGGYRLPVRGGHGRAERNAHMVVRATKVTLQMQDEASSQAHLASVWCVWTVEVETTPAGERPLNWMLLTTRPVRHFTDAKLTIYGYSQRWRVEEFHKAWKTGACNVEDLQLRSERAIRGWATVLAADAMRMLRMTYLAREEPSRPATDEFTRDEIHAVYLAMSKSWDEKRIPTIGKLVAWIADIGGHSGKASGAHAGVIVLARGWDRVAPLVPVVTRLLKLQPA